MKNVLVRFLFGLIALICCSFLFGLDSVFAKSIPFTVYNTAQSTDDYFTINAGSPRINFFLSGHNPDEADYVPLEANPIVMQFCAQDPFFEYANFITFGGNMNGTVITATSLKYVSTTERCTIRLPDRTREGRIGFLSFTVKKAGHNYESAETNVAEFYAYWYASSESQGPWIQFLTASTTTVTEIETSQNTRVIFEEINASGEKTDTTTCNNTHWYGKVLCWFSDLFNAIGNGFTSVVNWFGNVFSAIGNGFDDVVDWFSDLFTALGNWFAGIGQSIWSFFSSAISNISDFLSDIYDVLSGNYSSSDTNGIVDWFEDLNSEVGIEDIITAPVEILSDVSNYYWDNSNNSSHPKSLTLTYKNKDIVLPDGNTFWNRLGAFRGPYNMLFGGFILYSYLLWIYKIWLKLFDPEDDRVEVIKL